MSSTIDIYTLDEVGLSPSCDEQIASGVRALAEREIAQRDFGLGQLIIDTDCLQSDRQRKNILIRMFFWPSLTGELAGLALSAGWQS